MARLTLTPLADCLDGWQEEMVTALREAREVDEITPPLPPGGMVVAKTAALRAAAPGVAAAEGAGGRPAGPPSSSAGAGGAAAVGGAAASSGTAPRVALPSEAELPCALNFTTEVEHQLTCTTCGHRWCRLEVKTPRPSRSARRQPGPSHRLLPPWRTFAHVLSPSLR